MHMRFPQLAAERALFDEAAARFAAILIGVCMPEPSAIERTMLDHAAPIEPPAAALERLDAAHARDVRAKQTYEMLEFIAKEKGKP